jgi:DNA-binding response OmpR family regulator
MMFAVVAPISDDSAALRNLCCNETTAVDFFSSGRACLEALADKQYCCLVIDWELPDMEGSTFLKSIRGNIGWDIPIICLSVQTNEECAADILRIGADDFMSKPLRPTEFMARIHALQRRFGLRSNTTLSFGNIEIDRETPQFSVAGIDITLTPREYELAFFLLQNIGRDICRAELLQRAWPKSGVTSGHRTIDTHMSRLRKKLSLDGRNGFILSAIYGRGYRLDSTKTPSYANEA